MSSPGGDEVGRVSVRVSPDSSRFDDELRQQLNDLKDFEIKVVLDEEDLRRQLEELRNEDLKIPVKFDPENARDDIERAVAGAKIDPIDIPATVDLDNLDKELKQGALRIDPIEVPLKVEDTLFSPELQRARDAGEIIARDPILFQLDLDQLTFERKIAATEAEIAKLRTDGIEIAIQAKTEQFEEAIGKVRLELGALEQKEYTAEVQVKIDEKAGELSRLQTELAALDRASVEPEVKLQIEHALLQLAGFAAELGVIDNKRIDVVAKMDIDTLKADSEISAFVARERVRRPITLNVDIDKDRLGLVASGLAASMANVFSDMGSVVKQGFGGAFTAAGGYLSDFGSKFDELGGKILPVVGMAAQFGAIGAAIAVAGAGITVAWGAAATAIAAIPGALGLVGAAVGTVALGMDGIKAAAKSIKPEFDALKKSVSDTFEKGLTPVFQSLATIFPKLQGNINGVASTLVLLASSMTEFLTSAAGVKLLQGVFDNVSVALDGMRTGLIDIVAATLIVANQTGVYDALTSAVNTFGRAFKTAVFDTIKDGSLNAAFVGLKDTLDLLASAFVGLVKNGIEVFANAAPGANRFIDSLGNFFNRFDWVQLGKDVGGVFDGLAGALDKIPDGTIKDIQSGFDDLAKTFEDPAFQQSLANMASSIGPALRELDELIGFFGQVGDGIADMLKWLDLADQKLKKFIDWWNGAPVDDNGHGILTKDATWWQNLMDSWDGWIKKVKDKWGELQSWWAERTLGAPAVQTGSINNGNPFGDLFDFDLPTFKDIDPPELGNGWDDLSGEVKDAFDAMVDEAKAGAKRIQDAVTTGMAGVRAKFDFSGIGTSFGLTFQRLVGTATLGMEAIVVTVTDGMTKTRAAFDFTGIGTSVGLTFQRLVGTTTLGMAAITVAVVDGMTQVRAAFDFSTVGASVGLVFQNLIGTVTLGMASIAQSVLDGMPAVQAAFDFTTVGLSVGLAFQNMIGTVSLGMDSIATTVTEKMPVIIAAMNFANIGLSIGLAFQGMIGTVSLGMDSLATTITEKMPVILAAFNFANLGITLGLAFQGMVGTTSLGMAAIAATVAEGMPAIYAAFNFANLGATLGLTFVGMVGTTTLGMAAIAAAVATGMVAINAAWQTTWLGSMIATITGFWAQNIAAVTGGMGQMLSAVTGGLAGILGFWRSNWQTLISVVTTAMPNVVNAVRGGLQQAIGVIQGYIGQFQGVGTALMNGLRAGITAAAGAIANAAAAVVRGALAAARAAGIVHSPSRAMMEIGGYLGEGLAIGIEKTAPRVAAAADTMASAAVDSADKITAAFSGDQWASDFNSKVEASFGDVAASSSTKDVVGQLRKLNGTADQSSYLSAIVSLLQAIYSQNQDGGSAALGAQVSRQSAELGVF